MELTCRAKFIWSSVTELDITGGMWHESLPGY